MMRRGAIAGVVRKRPVDHEGLEQRALFHWLFIRHREAWEHTFHPPNGGHRDKRVAAIMKGQGVKAGVPDLCMDLPRGAYHGMRMEFKATPPHDASVSPKQKEWRDRLEAAGYYAIVCKGLEAARAEVERYLSLGAFDGQTRLQSNITAGEKKPQRRLGGGANGAKK